MATLSAKRIWGLINLLPSAEINPLGPRSSLVFDGVEMPYSDLRETFGIYLGNGSGEDVPAPLVQALCEGCLLNWLSRQTILDVYANPFEIGVAMDNRYYRFQGDSLLESLVKACLFMSKS